MATVSHVTEADCSNIHSRLHWMLGILVSVAVVCGTALGGVVGTAMSMANKASVGVEVHKASSSEQFKYVVEELREIKQDLKELKDK